MQLLRPMPMLMVVMMATLVLSQLPGSSLGRVSHLSMIREGPPIPDTTCSDLGSTCFYSSDCCSGLCKINGNVCVLALPPVPEDTCTELGLTCFYSSDCCSGLCKVNGNICILQDTS